MHTFDADLSSHLRCEAFRAELIKAFKTLGSSPKRNELPSLHVTHDIDTSKGLHRALSLKRVEDELDVRSTWFLPSDEYPIPPTIAHDLREGCIIGSHDTRHDGRLIHTRKHEDLVRRLTDSRRRLQDIFDLEIRNFRSPLLQFSITMASALSESGYLCDFSIPCWDPVYPATMKGSGVECLQSFQIEGVVEFPLTLFSDHSVLYVLGLNTREARKFLIEQAKLVRSLGGDITLCVHPDYAFAADLEEYRELLVGLENIQRQIVQT